LVCVVLDESQHRNRCGQNDRRHQNEFEERDHSDSKIRQSNSLAKGSAAKMAKQSRGRFVVLRSYLRSMSSLMLA